MTYSRREWKKQVTRQRLLDSAWQLFKEHGYDHTTVEDITDAADVAKGTFFNYFETKQAILDEIALWRIEVLGNEALAAEDVPDSAVARIKLVMSALADELSPGQELTRHLFMARISAPIKHESAHRLGSIIQELVIQGQARNEVRNDLDAGLITKLLMTCFFHSFAWRDHANDRHGNECDPSPGKRPVNHRNGTFVESMDALMSGLAGPEWRMS